MTDPNRAAVPIDHTIASPANGAEEGGGHRQALRSSMIVGGAQVVTIAAGLARTKVAALILGPAGVGAIGLLQNLLQTASSLAAFGVGTAGPQQIASAGDDPERLSHARYALAALTLACALAGGLMIWAARIPLSALVFGDRDHPGEVGWLAVGVALTVVTAGQNALLIGLRRIGDAARLGIVSSILAAAIGTVAILGWRKHGVIVFVLATPVAMAATGFVLVRRGPRWRGERRLTAPRLRGIATLARLGAAFVLAGVAGSLGQLALRAVIGNALGLAAVGQFQAAWFISMTYVGFVLAAMGADYYPRLSALINDRAAAHRLVEEQTEIALLLAAPVLLATVGLAPYVIALLYSRDFVPAVAILRWQVIADLFKVAAYPLGYLLLARGRAWTFMVLETGINLVMLAGIAALMPFIGLQASGVAVLIGYLAYLAALRHATAAGSGYRWSAATVRLLALLLAGLAGAFAVGAWNAAAGAGVGVALALVAAATGYARLKHALPAMLTTRIARAARWLRHRGKATDQHI